MFAKTWKGCCLCVICGWIFNTCIMSNETQNNSKGEIVIYQTEDGKTSVNVRLENDTVWLSQEMMASLFEKDRTDIGRHIRNIYKEGELSRDGTCAKFAHMGSLGVQPYTRMLYNLDVIISVGYRVKSQRGTQFRIWANSVLKEYLIKGYVVRFNLIQQKYEDLKALVEVVGRTMRYLGAPADDHIKPIFDVVKDYTYALDTLDAYDYQELKIDGTTAPERFHATYENAMEAIHSLKSRFGRSDLFGVQKPLLRGREQTHCSHPISLVHAEQRHPLSARRLKAHRRCLLGCLNADDCGKPHRRDGDHGKSYCESDK